jgi:L-alanine-DL-glutamate epimerase-like enolase superfamily enzyme
MQWQKDIQVCQAVREAVGGGYRLMLDSVWAYTYPEALRVGLAAQELGFYWYEDPLSDQDIYNYVKLKERLDIPIMATEQPFNGLDAYPIWITQRATDYLRGDVHNKGGITNCIKTAHLAEAFRMNYEVHHGNNSLNNVANLHIVMAIKNTEYFEVLWPEAAQKFGLVQDIEVDGAGHVHAPAGPGLGYDIDFDLIQRNKIATLS